MTDFSKGPEEIVEDLINLLVDRYESGFSIFKELLQNADDAGAKRLLVSGYAGFPIARNPLLRSPALVVVNDGPVLAKDFAAMKKASGGGKADEAGKVGRFGLGQKSVFHFCDAFVCLAWIDGERNGPRLDVLNPFERIPGAVNAAGEWKEAHDSDIQLLAGWAESRNFTSGMMLYLPLRSDPLSPGGSLQISNERWTPSRAVADIAQERELAASFSCLRHVRRVEIDSGDTLLTYTLVPDLGALAGPDAPPEDRPIGGSILRDGKLFARFSGLQCWKEQGNAVELKERPDWPFRLMLNGKREPEKAFPHGAAIAVQTPRSESQGRLRLFHTVYLPVGDPLANVPLAAGSGDIDILLHGCLFPSSDRKRILTGNDAHIQDRWNRLLLAEATLPLALEAIASLMPSLPEEVHRYGLVGALAGTDWWKENTAAVCGTRALARVWDGIGKPRWEVVEASRLRPIPFGDTTSCERLIAAWPDLHQWCAKQNIIFSLGSVLGEQEPRWRDEELAYFIGELGPAAFTRTRIAETLAAILRYHSLACGPLTRQALAQLFRAAIAGNDDFAAADKIRELTAFLPPQLLLTLPKSVEKRAVLAALASATPMLPLRDEWSVSTHSPSLNVGDTIALLAALESLLAERSLEEQATAAVNAILRLGPSINELAANERARHLAIVPVTRVHDRQPCRLTLGQIAQCAQQGLLFGRQPLAGLDELADAVIDPVVYRVTWKTGEGFIEAGSKLADLVQVLKAARRFGEEQACGKLAARLYELADREELRRLVAMAPDLPSHARLLEMGSLPSVLASVADELREQHPADRVISPAVSDTLSRQAKTKIGIEVIDARLLGDWLLEALRHDQWPSISESAAEAILASGIEDALLRQLPLNRTTSGLWCAADDRLFIARPGEVPHELERDARIAELWPDNAVRQVQQRLIPKWSPEAQIKTALATAQPHVHAGSIARALCSDTEISVSLISELKTAPWVPIAGQGLTPRDLLNLPDTVSRALRDVIDRDRSLPTLNDLPNALRDQAILQALRKYELLLNTRASLEFAGAIAGEAGVVGLAADGFENIAGWRDLARGGHHLGTNGWSVVSAVLALEADPGDIDSFARELVQPRAADAMAQLNALARIIETAPPQHEADAARRLHRAIYDQWQSQMLIGGFLPGDLLVPSRSGQMQRAALLGTEASGVQPAALLDRHYAQGLDTDQAVVRGDALPASQQQNFYERLKDELERFREFAIPSEAILFLLAMLGRDAAIVEIASAWEEQRPFDRICDELDDVAIALDLPKDAVRDRVSELRFEISSSRGGIIAVRSAAGGVALVPLENNSAWLVDCIMLESQREAGRRVHPYSLSLAPVSIADDDHARQLLEDFVDRLAPVLVLGLPSQRLALKERFAACFTDNQASLDETCNDLKRVIDDRLQGLKPGEQVRLALKEFHRNRHRDPKTATEALWEALQTKDAAVELLSAVRQKIAEMGYASERVLFELFQNADDALESWQGHEPGRIRIEAHRNAEGEIERLKLVHWGRPINHLGINSELGRERGYGNDLANMLAINHSAKEGERQTGRFGLGFKTVHMLANEIGIASGRHIVTRIRGGMIPHHWPAGAVAAQPYRSPGLIPTLFELPIPPNRAEAAKLAFDTFTHAAPWLAAIAPRIGQIEICDCDGSDAGKGAINAQHRARAAKLGEGLRTLELSTGRRILEFSLDNGFRLFMAFGRSGPEEVRDARQFWHLVPLDGIERRGDWVMEGRFAVDPGRTHLSGSHEDQERQFARLGRSLGERLVALHDALEGDWLSFAEREGLDPEGFADFWQRLIDIFAKDLHGFGPEAKLHGPGSGLGRLIGEARLIPLAGGGSAKAGEVSHELVGALCESTVFAIVQEWPAFASQRAGVVAKEAADILRSLGFDTLRPVNLVSLMTTMIENDCIAPELAQRFAPLVADEILDKIDKNEESTLRLLLREARWLAEDGSWQPIRSLAFPAGTAEAERLRAAFAPPSGRLSVGYGDAGQAIAEFAREQAGQNEEVIKAWVATAGVSDDRALAVLQYLVTADQRTTAVLAGAASWLPKGEDLPRFPLLAHLDDYSRQLLLAKLGSTSLPAPSGPVFRMDATQALQSIAEWWEEEGPDLAARYDRAVYPEGFVPLQLQEDDDEAWFTMLGLATFHTLGRIKPEQSKSFVERARAAGWWGELARVRHDDDLRPFAELLRRWTEPVQDEPMFWLWRRCLPDLCMIARYIEEYRRFFRKLPQVLAAHPKISLRAQLRPHESHIWAEFGMSAGPIAQSMGIGANWTLRELIRHSVYNASHAEQVTPLAWSTTARVRRFFADLGLGPIEHGIDAGKLLYTEVAELIGEDAARFAGDGDLPLHLITTAKHRGVLDGILLEATGLEWRNADYDDDEGGYEI